MNLFNARRITLGRCEAAKAGLAWWRWRGWRPFAAIVCVALACGCAKFPPPRAPQDWVAYGGIAESPLIGTVRQRDPSLTPEQWLAQPADFSNFDAAWLEDEVFRQTLEFRQAHGARGLRRHQGLDAMARSHSEEMARLGYISHTSPTAGRRTLADRMDRARIEFRISAENIAYEPCVAQVWMRDDAVTRVERHAWKDVAANVIRHWAASSGHRANMLRSSLSDLGVGAALAERQGRPYVYITQNFCAP